MTEKVKLLSLRLQRKKYPAESIQQYILYSGDKIELNDEEVNDILSKIPAVWNTDKDRLTTFGLYEDGTFVCTREKEVYNYSTKSTQLKTYFFDAVTKEQLKEIIDLSVDFFNTLKLKKIDNFYNEVVESLSDLSYIKEKILNMRKESLSSTDYMFNSDYSFKNEEDRQKFIKYRQDWRDITETQAWKDNDLNNITMPVNPIPKVDVLTISSLLGRDIKSIDLPFDMLNQSFDIKEYENVMQNFTSILFKLRTLKVLSSLQIPLGYEYQEIDELEDTVKATLVPLETFYRDFSDEELNTADGFMDIWKKQISDIDVKLSKIDDHVKKYNFDFSISDILVQIIENTKNKIEEREQISSLIDDLNAESI